MIKIRAGITREPQAPYQIVDVDLAEPKAGEVLVKNVASGLCHTDEFGRTIGLPMPLVLGHEGAGIVQQVGPDVHGIEVGDHVAFSYATCGYCKNCISGKPFYCLNFNAINFGGVSANGDTKLFENGKPISMFFGQSSLASHSVVNARNVVKVDKDVDLALIAPFGCGIQTGSGAVLNVLQPEMDETIAIFGCGAVGMSAIMAAAVAGCEKIIAVGGNPDSLKLAMELGATHTVNRKEVEDVPATIREITGGGVNYAIDTSGNGKMILNAIRSTAYNGTIIPLAPTGVIENFDIGSEVLMQMRTVKGIDEGESNPKFFIPKLIRLYKEGRFPVDKIITKFKFEDLEAARQASLSGKVIKAVVTMD
nr:benzyl alcohol dehydrogenase [uncultured bacterium]